MSTDDVIAISSHTFGGPDTESSRPYDVEEDVSSVAELNSVREQFLARRTLPRVREIPSLGMESLNLNSTIGGGGRRRGSSILSTDSHSSWGVNPFSLPDIDRSHPSRESNLDDCLFSLRGFPTHVSSGVFDAGELTNNDVPSSTHRYGGSVEEGPILTSGSGGSNVRTIRLLSRMHRQQLYEPYLRDVSGGGESVNNPRGGRNSTTMRTTGGGTSNPTSKHHTRR
ncbi:unnamed protein product [Phytomonas sp. Hart1]|nr:unnamed protein product [Phytomonas sp. Hart1]|eukprot:CCW67535.1 unnamed protein product [Phytomonas sp. isolate Hart1]